jgi:transcriptional regulator of acetoin/glycerol metabolism
VTPAALEQLQSCRWPGNVRQLINALEYAAITSRGEEIDVQDLPANLAVDPACLPIARRRGAPALDAIREALIGAGGRRTAAARTLGISRVTLWKRMKEYGLTES